MTMGGHQVPGQGSGDDGFEEEGYDESQRAEILEVTRDGPTDGTIIIDLDPDVAQDDDEEEMEDDEIADEDDADEDDAKLDDDLDDDDEEDDVQGDFDNDDVEDASLADADRSNPKGADEL